MALPVEKLGTTYDVGTDPTTPRQIQLLQVKSGAGPFVGNPTQMALDPTDSFLFLLTPQHIDNVPPQFANTVHTMVVNQDGTLTELGASPAAIPVPPGTGPQGVVAITNGGGHEADDDEDEQGDDEDGGGGHNDGGSSERGRRFGSD